MYPEDQLSSPNSPLPNSKTLSPQQDKSRKWIVLIIVICILCLGIILAIILPPDNIEIVNLDYNQNIENSSLNPTSEANPDLMSQEVRNDLPITIAEDIPLIADSLLEEDPSLYQASPDHFDLSFFATFSTSKNYSEIENFYRQELDKLGNWTLTDEDSPQKFEDDEVSMGGYLEYQDPNHTHRILLISPDTHKYTLILNQLSDEKLIIRNIESIFKLLKEDHTPFTQTRINALRAYFVPETKDEIIEEQTKSLHTNYLVLGYQEEITPTTSIITDNSAQSSIKLTNEAGNHKIVTFISEKIPYENNRKYWFIKEIDF